MRYLVLLLLASALAAESKTIVQLQVEGATKLRDLAAEELAAVKARHENGAASADELARAERGLLDAELELVAAHGFRNAERLRREIDLLTKIEVLEARRYAAAQKLAEAGAVGADELRRRRVAHQLAWIERNFADQRAKAEPDDLERLVADRDRQRAKVRMLAARERLERREKARDAGRATDSDVRAAKRELIRAETEHAVAVERLRMAAK